MDITAILGIVITATVLAVVLKQYKSEYAVAVSLIAGAIIILRLIVGLAEPMTRLSEMLSDAGVKLSYFTAALKTLGICIISGFASDICKDFGQTALASFAVMAGKCAVFVISIPILTDLLEAAYRFIG